MFRFGEASLVFACCIYLSTSELTPYPPSGYRPQGRQFELPKSFEDNSNLQPQTQYGTPTLKPPSNQYFPGESSPGSRFNHIGREQNNNLQPQSQYGTPDQNSPPSQYLPSDPSSDGRFDNFDERQAQTPISRQYIPSEPSSQGTLNNFDRNVNNKYRELTKQNDETEARSGRQNYLPPNPTKRTRQRGYPEQTTRRQRKQEEPREEQETETPNVAISTAVTNGQYYLIQPNSIPQRVTSKGTPNENNSKSNGFTAKLIYQNVNPISPPFYTPFIAI